ncbi:arylamine N-acetyltransferase [Poseidonocella sp. HB161398]|uniref:arylamine N-acetyltransferase family protein n=1 Tax=Poseidonocella sp. HB161398 TaxID=2320855 RepID=UPI0019816BA7|nr:arylamine N-acetyltransferase [Poseidonocella sp. HB161398]
MTLTEKQLGAYLARIGMERPRTPDSRSLAALHRAHLMAFSWEAIDAFMGWPSDIAPDAAFAKMVGQRRGGWCYEMNGLFGAALSAMGFRVTRLCGGVNREILGDAAIGNHLTLQVDLDGPWLAEVGVGDAILEPVRMVTGPVSQRGFGFSIAPAGDGWLRFSNHARGMAKSFDFRPGHGGEAEMAASHAWLMRDPGSPFANALGVLRHTGDGYVSLQDDRLRRVNAHGISERRVAGAGQLAEIFDSVFGLDVPQVAEVWDRVREAVRDRAA